MRPLLLTAALALLLATPVAASAADFKDGDVLVGTSTGTYNVYDNGGTLLETIDQAAGGAQAVDCAFDRSGVLFTTAFGANQVIRFLGPAPHTRLAAIPVGASPESVSFARDGSFYVGHQSATLSLRKFSSAGTPIANFTPESRASLIDLSADQRTVFYTDRAPTAPPVVHRFDVESGANLPAFADLGGTARIADVKLLPPGDGSGGAIVAQTTTIKRVNGAGDVVATYDRTGEDSWFGIALDPDGQSFWAQTNAPGNVYRFNIATGTVDRGPLASAGSAFGICVKGSRTAALDNAPPSVSISTPAEGATFQQGQDVKAAFSCARRRQRHGHRPLHGHRRVRRRRSTPAPPGTKTFTRRGGRPRRQHRDGVAHLHRRGTALPPPVELKRILVVPVEQLPVPSARRSGSRASWSRTCPGARPSPRPAARSRAAAAAASASSRSATPAAT